MRPKIFVALAGNIGAGKSTAARTFTAELASGLRSQVL